MERLTIRNGTGRAFCMLDCGRDKAFDILLERVAAYEDAEEQGRLVVLPCKVGDTIYAIDGHLDKVFPRFASKEDMLTKIILGWGKRYFATPEEALAAAKKGGDK